MTTMRRGTFAVLAAIAFVAPPSAVAQMHGPIVSVPWVERHLDDEHVVVLHADLREERYAEGHLPGAHFLDLGRLVWDGDPAWGTEMRSAEEIQDALRDAGVTNDLHHIVLYSGNPLFAARAFMTLEVMGLQGRVHVLDGGLAAWREAGHPTATSRATVARGDVTVRPRDDILVDAEWIHARLDDDRVALVDARPDDEYTGEDGGMGGMANPGHIPGAHQMYWEELVTEGDVRLTKPTGELRELFRAAAADEGDTVVAYCMVGWRASYTYLTARVLGHDTKFYDGSWHDWGTRDDLPYVTGSSPR